MGENVTPMSSTKMYEFSNAKFEVKREVCNFYQVEKSSRFKISDNAAETYFLSSVSLPTVL